MLDKKYNKHFVLASYPRSGNHFVEDLFRHFDPKDTYFNIFHYSEVVRLNNDKVKVLTIFREPVGAITSYVILQMLLHSKFLEESSYFDIHENTVARLHHSDIVEEYFGFFEMVEKTGSMGILFEDLKSKPLEVMSVVNNRLGLGLNITDEDIFRQEEIAKYVFEKRRRAEQSLDPNWIYMSNYPREIYDKIFYKAIRQAVEESPKVVEARALFEAYRGKYKL